MKPSALIFLFLPVLACQSVGNKDKAYSINQASRPTKELTSLVLNKGDSLAYHDLYYQFVDSDKQYNELLFYSYVMAFKFHYPKAYMDVFYILCKIYNVKVEETPINLTGMDAETKNLAVECVKRAAQMNYLDTKDNYKSLIQ